MVGNYKYLFRKVSKDNLEKDLTIRFLVTKIKHIIDVLNHLTMLKSSAQRYSELCHLRTELKNLYSELDNIYSHRMLSDYAFKEGLIDYGKD